MRTVLPLQSRIRERIEQVAHEMKEHESEPRIDAEDRARIADHIHFFPHTTGHPGLQLGGVDGTGDFPSLSYADSFVYLTYAVGTTYLSNRLTGLLEPGPLLDPVFDIALIPETESERKRSLDQSFVNLAGLSIEDVIDRSDYRAIRAGITGKPQSTSDLAANLIRPHAADSGNIGLQLRSTAELGAILGLLSYSETIRYVLMDGTFSLPMVSRATGGTLFYEHLKRYCCVQARQQSVGFFALSKSHGLPSMDIIEQVAQEKLLQQQTSENIKGPAEHWYMRIPTQNIDGWTFKPVTERFIPPPSAISYLVRFHRTTPVMRLDMDYAYWSSFVRGSSESETLFKEQRIFEDLDYASHDQRAYGYPYPLKAAHDRASLSAQDREALRKQVIAAAVAQGMKHSLFRDASQATGHR